MAIFNSYANVYQRVSFFLHVIDFTKMFNYVADIFPATVQILAPLP